MSYDIAYTIHMKDEFSKTIRRLNRDLDKFRRKMEGVNRPVEKMSKDLKKVTREADKTSRVIKNKLNLSMGRLGETFKRTGRSMTRHFTLPVVGGFGLGLRTAAKFESKMINIHSYLKQSPRHLEKLAAKAREVAKTSVFTPDEVANSMFVLGKTGLKTNDILRATSDVLNLASAGMTDMETSARLVGSSIKTFNLDFSKTKEIADMMAMAISDSDTDVGTLMESMTQLGSTASGLGVDLNKTVSMIMLMSQAGLKGGKAGRQLAALLLALNKNAKPLEKKFKSMGLSAFNANGDIVNLQDAFKGLEQIMLSAEARGKKAGFIKFLAPERTAQKALRTFLIRGAKEFDKFNETLIKSSGTAERMSKMHMEGVIGSMKKLQSATQELSLTIFDKDVLDKISEILVRIKDILADISSEHPLLAKFIAWGAALLALLGPILLSLGKILVVMRVLGITNPFSKLLISINPVLLGLTLIAIALKKLNDIGFSKIEEGFKSIGTLSYLTVTHPGQVSSIGMDLFKKKLSDIKYNVTHPGSTLSSFLGFSPKVESQKSHNAGTAVSGNANININVAAENGSKVTETTTTNKMPGISLTTGSYSLPFGG